MQHLEMGYREQVNVERTAGVVQSVSTEHPIPFTLHAPESLALNSHALLLQRNLDALSAMQSLSSRHLLPDRVPPPQIVAILH